MLLELAPVFFIQQCNLQNHTYYSLLSCTVIKGKYGSIIASDLLSLNWMYSFSLFRSTIMLLPVLGKETGKNSEE
jgi:hypothetical protein